jgi:hypothetical protein
MHCTLYFKIRNYEKSLFIFWDNLTEEIIWVTSVFFFFHFAPSIHMAHLTGCKNAFVWYYYALNKYNYCSIPEKKTFHYAQI